MKIVHLMLACFYIDNCSYQENLLPKYHKKMGYDVEIIASLESYDSNGNSIYLDAGSKYVNEDGISVTRLDYKRFPGANKLRYYIGLRQELDRIGPDIIFIHGVQFSDIRVVAKYCKLHKNVNVYADNHSDFSNSARNWVSKKILHEIVWRRCAQIINPYVNKFYGVLPARVDFLTEMYGLPPQKCELLLMGADDEIVNDAIKLETIAKTRREFDISETDFLIVTGGKINSNRPETIELMKAVSEINIPNIKLLVFGTASNELKAEFVKCCSLKNIVNAGWQESRKTYYLMAAADLIVFPGLHSVMWEQSVAVGVPGLFRKISGFEHIDVGGNVQFLKEPSKECLKATIEQLIQDKQGLKEMKKVAVEKGMKMFSYNEISKRSIE